MWTDETKVELFASLHLVSEAVLCFIGVEKVRLSFASLLFRATVHEHTLRVACSAVVVTLTLLRQQQVMNCVHFHVCNLKIAPQSLPQ